MVINATDTCWGGGIVVLSIGGVVILGMVLDRVDVSNCVYI